MTQPNVVVVTGASSGFGNLTARALAQAGHIVYAGMRPTTTRNVSAVAPLAQVAKDRGVRMAAVEMDVQEQDSVDAAIDQVMTEQGRVDIVVHNAGRMVLGPAEAFTPPTPASDHSGSARGTSIGPLGQSLPHPRKKPPKEKQIMPFANFKVPAGTITAEDKKKIVERTTDLYAEIYGERARPATVVLIDEVVDGGWGVAGSVLTAAVLNGDA